MKLLIGLVSDFYDFYDHFFESKTALLTGSVDYVLVRNSKSRVFSRETMFRFVSWYTLNRDMVDAPMNGEAYLLKNYFQKDIPVVSHSSLFTSKGEGKVLTNLYSPWLSDDTFCVQYIKSDCSYRLLCIGASFYYLKYTSNDWRSNVGDVKIELVNPNSLPNIHVLTQLVDNTSTLKAFPLLAIDFVIGDQNKLYVLDINIAPGIPANLFDAYEVYRNIELYYLSLVT